MTQSLWIGVTVDLLTTAQVAKLTGLSPATLRYWRHADEGPASFRLGRKVMYRRVEVARWIAAQEKATTRGGVA
jgi:predicted DNA-binding transcriptional regulator AlpA